MHVTGSINYIVNVTVVNHHNFSKHQTKRTSDQKFSPN